MLSDEVLNDEQECALADGWIQDDLKVFHELLESLYSPVSQNELHMVVFQVFFLHLSDHSFKVDNHDHLISVGLPPAEVKSPTFELVYFVSGWLRALRVIDDAQESLRAIFFLLWVLWEASGLHLLGIKLLLLELMRLLKLYLLLLLFVLEWELDLLALAELDEFPLECLANLHLCERLLDWAHLYALCVVYHRLSECAGPCGSVLSLGTGRSGEVVAICTDSTLAPLQIIVSLFLWWLKSLQLLDTVVGDI